MLRQGSPRGGMFTDEGAGGGGGGGQPGLQSTMVTRRRKIHGEYIRVGFLEALGDEEESKLRPAQKHKLKLNPLASPADVSLVDQSEEEEDDETSVLLMTRTKNSSSYNSACGSTRSSFCKHGEEKNGYLDSDIDDEECTVSSRQKQQPVYRKRFGLMEPEAYVASLVSTPQLCANARSERTSSSKRSLLRSASSKNFLSSLNDGGEQPGASSGGSSFLIQGSRQQRVRPVEKFKAAGKKVLQRIRQRTKAMAMLQRGQARSPGHSCVLRAFGSSGAVVNPSDVTMEQLFTIYTREIGFRLRSVINPEKAQLWVWHPRLNKRERVISDVYLRCVLGKRLHSIEEQRISTVHRVLTDLGRECCVINGGSPQRLALALWQFCWGPDFEYQHLLAHGNLLQALLEDDARSELTCGALWSICEHSNELREVLICQLGAVEAAVERFKSCGNLVGLLATFTCCESGLQRMLEGKGVRCLLNLYSCDDNEVSPRMKALLVTTLTNCWPRSLPLLRIELQNDAHMRCFDFLLDVLDDSIDGSSGNNNNSDGSPKYRILNVDEILQRIPALCLLSQLGEVNPRHSSFITDKVIGIVARLGMAAYLIRSNKTHINKVAYLDVLLQACCCAVKSWVKGHGAYGKSPAEPELVALLRNVFHTQAPLNQIKATHALLEVFNCAKGDNVDAKVDQLVLSRLRLCHSNAEISKVIFAKAFLKPECCERLNHHGALVVVLNMMRHYVKTKEGLALASKAALTLAIAPNVQNFSVSLMLQLLQASNGDSRNSLLCVLYGVLTNGGAMSEDTARELAQHSQTYVVLLHLLANLANVINKPMFELVLLIMWHINPQFNRPDKELNDLANSLVGHMMGNCAHLRSVVTRICDYHEDHGLDSKALLNVTFEKEVQMWAAVSFKRSFLETNTLIPRSLRTASSIIGFYETQRHAVEAFVDFENLKEKARNKFLLPITSNMAADVTGSNNSYEKDQRSDNGNSSTPNSLNDNADMNELEIESVAARSRMRLLVAIIADLFRLSKERLVEANKTHIAKKKQELVVARERRAKQQEKLEISLELDEIPGSRLKFKKLERVQRKADLEKLKDLVLAQAGKEASVHSVLNTKEIVRELFFIGFCDRFDGGAKEIVLWLLWELLFERRYVNEMKIDNALDGLTVDDIFEPEENDVDNDGDNRVEDEFEEEDLPGEEDLEDEDLSDGNFSDDEDDSDDNVSNAMRSRNNKQVHNKVKTEREKWQKKSFLFGRQSVFYETRFASMLVAVAELAVATNNVSLEVCAARLFQRLANICLDTSIKGVSSIAKVKGIECLLELLRSDTAEVQHCAALALRQLSLSQVHQEIMSVGGGFALLLRLGSAPEGHRMEKRTQDVVREILVLLRGHPCNGTRLYQAEMKGMQSELVKRPKKKLSFHPAVKEISVSSTPRTNGAYKVQLLPLLFQSEYSEHHQQQMLKHVQSASQVKDTSGESSASFPNNNNSATPPLSSYERNGPTFTFFSRSRMKASNNTKRFSFQRYLEDKYWDMMLAKFDRHTVRRPLHNAPAFVASDGHEFFLCLKASVPPQPVLPERARVFEEQLHGLLVPVGLKELCELRGVEDYCGADKSKIEVLTMFCFMGEENDGDKRPVDDVMTTSVRSTTMGVSAGPPPLCKVTHPLLGHLGRQLGKILDQESDHLHIFFVNFDPEEAKLTASGSDNEKSAHRAAHLSKRNSSTSQNPCSDDDRGKNMLTLAQSMLIKKFESNDHWASVDRDEECVRHDLALQSNNGHKLLVDEDSRSKIQSVLIKHASLLIAVFRFYAVNCAKEPYHEHSNEMESIAMLKLARFNKLLVDCRTPGMDDMDIRESFELAFKSTISDSSVRNPAPGSKGEQLANSLKHIPVINLHKHGVALLRSEFLECLLRVAIIVYEYTYAGVHIAPEAALHAFIQDHIVPVLGYESLLTPNHFSINRFHTPHVLNLLVNNVDRLRAMFDVFSGKSEVSKLWGGLKQKRMALPDWTQLVTKTVMRVIKYLPQDISNKAFALSLKNIPDQLGHWHSAVTLDFAGFLEAIMRLEDMLILPKNADLELVKVHDVIDFYQFLHDTEFWKGSYGLEFRNCGFKSLLSFDAGTFAEQRFATSGSSACPDTTLSNSWTPSKSSINLTPYAPPQQGKCALGDQLENLIAVIEYYCFTPVVSSVSVSPITAWMHDNASLNVEHIAASIATRDAVNPMQLAQVVDARQAFATLRNWVTVNSFVVVRDNFHKFLHEIGGSEWPKGHNVKLAMQALETHLPYDPVLRT